MTHSIPDRPIIDEPAIRPHWQTWERVQQWVAATMFGLTSLFACIWEPRIEGGRPVMLALSVLFMGWYFAIFTRPFARRMGADTARALVYLALGIGLWVILLFFDEPYMMYLFMLFSAANALLTPRRSMIVTFIVAAIAGWRQIVVSGNLVDPIAIFLLFTAISVIALTRFIQAVMEQSLERAQLIEELRATQDILAASERQTGILEERQRLAREIHDTLAQSFISIIAHLESADAAMPAKLETATRHMDQARASARSSLVDARRLVQALRPEQLEETALHDAIDRVARQWSEQADTPVSVRIDGQPRVLPPAFETTLLRAAQEALHNVSRHAQASQVTITLSYLKDAVILDVDDNGVGFVVRNEQLAWRGDRRDSYGLTAMAERVAQVGGELSVESEPGEGTTIAVALPG